MQINGIIEKNSGFLNKIDSYFEFKESSLKINAVERALTVCVEIMIDVSERILALKQIAPKNSSIENFRELERLNIIQSFEKYADMIRFRNFVVHRYENIDTQILFTIITKRLDAFSAFIDEVRKVC